MIRFPFEEELIPHSNDIKCVSESHTQQHDLIHLTSMFDTGKQAENQFLVKLFAVQ